MAEIKEITERIPWALVIILSAFLGIFGTLWGNFLPARLANYYSFGEIVCALGVTAAPFIVLIFTAIFSKLTKKSVSSITLTYLYAIGITSSWFLYSGEPEAWTEVMASRFMGPELSAQYVPWFMAPPASIASQLVSGHVPIPWGDWLPSILFFSTYYILLGIFFILVATLFRRQWIDAEKITLPHTLIAYELVNRFPEKKPLMQRLGKPFLLGIILGMAVYIPYTLTGLFPWFPDFFGWTGSAFCGQGLWHVASGTTLASIAGLTTVSDNPVVAAVGYIVPLSISFNMWFWELVWLILMQVSYGLGYYTGIENSGGCGRTGWCSPSGMIDPPLKMAGVTMGGGLIGLAVINLILSRRYIVETLRASFAKHSSRLEVEKDEALTYRNTYILLGSTLILIVIFFMIEGMGVGVATLVAISLFLYWLAYARIYGLTGLSGQGASHGNTLLRLFVWPTPPDQPSTEFALSSFQTLDGMSGTHHTNGTIYSGFASYKMAVLTGTSNRSILKVITATTVIMSVTVVLTTIWQFYAFGATTLPGELDSIHTTGFFSDSNLSDLSRWAKMPSSEPLAPYVLAGFLIVCVLDFLHARFIWFPFNGIGFVVGMGRLNIKWGFWGPFLVAWILKVITLRVGGSKTYENFGVPIAAGFVIGYIIALIFGGALGVLRFFIPY